MAVELTEFLKLRVDDSLTALAKYNLRKLDTLGARFLYDSEDNTLVRAISDITIEPEASAIGGSGTGGALNLGTASHSLAGINLYGPAALSSTLALTGAATLSSTLAVTGAVTLSNLTASRAIATNGSKVLVSSATTGTELGYVSGVTSAIQTQLDAKLAISTAASTYQPIDSDLTALAALSSTGLIARTGSGAAAARTLTAGSSKLTVTNGDGVSGNPTVDVAQGNLSLGSIGGLLTLTSQVTGALPIANGGTAATTAAAAFAALSPLTTKGDLQTYSTIGTRLAVGTDGQVLSADSTKSTGLNWIPALANPMTTAQDLIVGGVSGAATRLGVGSDGSVLTVAAGALTYAALTNSNISASAAIAYSKLALSASIVNADIGVGAAIAYSKLALTGTIVNADVASGAAIAYSKLALTGALVNADVGAGAAIAYSKLALSASIATADLASGLLVPIAKGGTGQITANAALNALLPTQTSNSGKVLKTDGTDTSWVAVASTVTTTRGDLIYRDASADARLAIGASGTVLKSNGTDPAWGQVANADVGAGAAIAYSKLALSASIATGDLASGLLVPVGKGGTGLTAGTSGGIPYYSATSTLASSGALTAAALVLGGGAGATPTSLALGTANQLLGMNSGASAHEYKTLALGTTAQSNDLGIVNAANSITIHVPDASGSTRGVVNGLAQSFDGVKTFGNGIKLGAGSTLSVYEQGTWTPVLTIAGGNGTSSITPTCRYTRIGNRVFLSGYVTYSRGGGPGTGAVTLINLPYASSNISNFYQTITVFASNGVTVPANRSVMNTYIVANTSTVTLVFNSTNGGANTPVLATDLANGTELVFSGNYQVD